MTSADRCRAMGWGPGTVLRGAVCDIVVTAVGRYLMLAQRTDGYEAVWTIANRDWRQVGDHGRLWHGPGDDQ